MGSNYVCGRRKVRDVIEKNVFTIRKATIGSGPSGEVRAHVCDAGK